jgi:hypothetical protein
LFLGRLPPQDNPCFAAKNMINEQTLGYITRIAVLNGNLNLAIRATGGCSSALTELELTTLLAACCRSGQAWHAEAISILLGRPLTPEQGEILIPPSLLRGFKDETHHAASIACRPLSMIEMDTLTFVNANRQCLPFIA